MLTRSIKILVILMICATAVVAQEQPKLTVNSNGEIVAPPQWEEYARRRKELLKNPDFLRLKLNPVAPKHEEQSEAAPEPFRVGGKIRFELLMTNTLSEPFIIDVGSSYHNTRPLLIKDGQTAQYHKEATKLVENKEKIFNRIHGLSITLHQGETQSVGTIDLSRWYELLEQGRYLLTVRYRPLGSEKWIESPPVTFEVVSK